MKIFLIGMPGCGKSTLGKPLANKLKLSFADLDDLIVKEAGKPIKEIFAEDGEEYFRKMESRLLISYSENNSDFLMATGGGAPCFYNNIDYINKVGISLFLDVPVATIVERLFKTKLEERPLLKDLEYETAMMELGEKLDKRLPFYNKAHIKLSGDDIDENTAAASINNFLNP